MKAQQQPIGSAGFAVELTPEIRRAIAITNGFAASNFGIVTPDLEDPQVEVARGAATQIQEHVFGELGEDGTPTAGLGLQLANAFRANEEEVRTSISQNVVSGKTDPADYYEILCDLLATSGMEVLPGVLTPELARELLGRFEKVACLAELEGAGDSCSPCALCAACSACSVCGACGTCIASVAIAVGATAATGAVLGIGGVGGYLFG